MYWGRTASTAPTNLHVHVRKECLQAIEVLPSSNCIPNASGIDELRALQVGIVTGRPVPQKCLPTGFNLKPMINVTIYLLAKQCDAQLIAQHVMLFLIVTQFVHHSAQQTV